MEHPEWPKKLCLQLLVTLDLDIFAVQLYFVIGGIAFRLNAFIMGSLLKFLSVVKVFLSNNNQLS